MENNDGGGKSRFERAKKADRKHQFTLPFMAPKLYLCLDSGNTEAEKAFYNMYLAIRITFMLKNRFGYHN